MFTQFGLWGLGAMLVALLTAGVANKCLADQGSRGADLLERPAEVSLHASKAVMLAVGRAGQRIVGVGEQGIILLSDDNGGSWRQAKVPSSVTLTNVRFTSASKGWAVGHGGVVLKTVDAGGTWVKQFDGRQAAQRELEAANTKVGRGELGAEKHVREAERLVADGPDKPLLDVFFSDENNGLVVGAYGLIFGTSDGGTTWRSLRHHLNNPKGKHLYSIHAAGSELYITGEQGALYRSGDGARTFTEVKTPYVGTYFGSVSASRGGLVVFGLRGNAYHTADRGVTWQKIALELPVTVTAGSSLSDGSLLLVDETGRILQSHDGGQRFLAVPVPQPSPFTGIVQASDGSLVLSGARGLTRLTLKTNLAEHKR